jgi:ATP-dependent Clp protease ATP-binding subunit ClpB
VLAVAENEADTANNRVAAMQKDKAMLKEEVDEEDIARVVSKWTGIPLSKLMEAESHKLLEMEGRLKERVVGQDEALGLVSDCIRRSRTGLSDQNRPLGRLFSSGRRVSADRARQSRWHGFLSTNEIALVRSTCRFI